MACVGQHVGCGECMAYYLTRYANSCTYARPQVPRTLEEKYDELRERYDAWHAERPWRTDPWLGPSYDDILRLHILSPEDPGSDPSPTGGAESG